MQTKHSKDISLVILVVCFILIACVGLSGCCTHRVPLAPLPLPPVETKKVEAKVDKALEDLLIQQKSLVTLEEKLLFAQKVAQEIERISYEEALAPTTPDLGR